MASDDGDEEKSEAGANGDVRNGHVVCGGEFPEPLEEKTESVFEEKDNASKEIIVCDQCVLYLLLI